MIQILAILLLNYLEGKAPREPVVQPRPALGAAGSTQPCAQLPEVSRIRGVGTTEEKRGHSARISQILTQGRDRIRFPPPGAQVGDGVTVMGVEEGTCWDEHGVLYASDESLNSTPETNTTLYIN
uniref:Uncharacterized protein n=1 Tax=Ursus americanus TaxID=9643 RepID=A0A452S5U7_URSAM